MITDKFEKMGARAKVQKEPRPTTTPPRNRWGFRRQPFSGVSLNILRDKAGSYFSIRAGADVELQILDTQPKDRHLLLMARTDEGKAKFLCGHDERDWFVAAIPESSSASNVKTAKEALKPDEVLASESTTKMKRKKRGKRKNPASIRQGEWFFIPRPDLKVDPNLILKDEPLQRGRGKPHMAAELYRTGGQTVYVNSRHPNGISAKAYNKLSREEKKAGWRMMQRDPKAYVRGKIRHGDHKTVVLTFWHEVTMNTETQSRAMRHVAFLD